MRLATGICGILFVIAGCGGSLSDEQRKQMLRNMEEHQIVRVTEVEITEAAYAEGRQIAKTLDSLRTDSASLQTFLKGNAGRIKFIKPGADDIRPLERELLSAYAAAAPASLVDEDNVQKLRNGEGGFDSLLYTKPVIVRLPDGGDHLKGVWNIWLPKKALVLEISRSK